MSTRREGTPTIAEVRSWGATCSVPQMGSCWGLSRSSAYEYARKGLLPVRVIQVGSRQRVLVSELIAALTGEAAA
jgi:predicted DNA-binding transcriptional regulator AlpA